MRRLAFSLAYLLAAHVPGYAAEPLEVGFGAATITPPVGYRLSGYFNERFSTGEHDPLQAKAIVLKQGNAQFAWVFCDLIGVPAAASAKARDAIERELGIHRGGVFVAGTHSHTGPLYFGALRDYYHERSVAANGRDVHEAVDFREKLVAKVLWAVARAVENAQPTDIAVGHAEQFGLSFNRRYLMRDGSVQFNPGKLNPDIVRPAGPIDPQIGLLQFRRAGKPAGGLTVFALHLDTIGGTQFAADYPYFLEQQLREKFGLGYTSVFGIGACGNVNHIDVMHDRPQTGFVEAERIGKTLGATIATACAALPAIEAPRLAAAWTTVELPLQRYSDEQIAAAKVKLAKVGGRELPWLEQVEAVKIANVAQQAGQSLPAEVQAFRLSDSVALVALPGEVFVELGLAIKQASPFATTLVVELCNDDPNYIPTRAAFAEGSYEPTNSLIAPGGGEMLVEAAKKLLAELRGL